MIRQRRTGPAACPTGADPGADGYDVGYLFFSFPTTANNGNPSGQNMQYAAAQSLPAVTLHQTYAYDGLNRLSSVAETGPGPSWSQTFGYDTVGNRWLSGGLQIDQFTPTGNGYDGNNHMSGLQYADGRGNVTQIGGYTYQYDAENRLIASTLASYGQVIASATYSYDGDGRRVMKQQSGGVATHYVYDAQGNLAVENTVSGTPPGVLWGTAYQMGDHLGSLRMQTDSNGDQRALWDYAPFGEELTGADGRDARWGGPGTGFHFTGKEQEGAEGDYMHYFGARYYSGGQGRFTSPDEPLVDQWEENPQSWNLYNYSRNNPLRFVDPTGRCSEAAGGYTDAGEGLFPGPCAAGQIGGTSPQQVNVNAQGGNAIVAFGLNAFFALSNTANDYFAWMFQQRPDVLQNTPTNRQFTGQAAALTVGVATAFIGPGAEAAQAPREIKVTWKGLLHVLGRHSGGAAGKSFFGDSAAITGLVKAAESTTAVPSIGGKFVRTVDAGRVIGTDVTTGQATSVYTVVTDARGELVTAFPGNPRR